MIISKNNYPLGVVVRSKSGDMHARYGTGIIRRIVDDFFGHRYGIEWANLVGSRGGSHLIHEDHIIALGVMGCFNCGDYDADHNCFTPVRELTSDGFKNHDLGDAEWYHETERHDDGGPIVCGPGQVVSFEEIAARDSTLRHVSLIRLSRNHATTEKETQHGRTERSSINAAGS